MPGKAEGCFGNEGVGTVACPRADQVEGSTRRIVG